MIDLYYAATPNGQKIRIFLLEAGLAHQLVPVNLGQGEQFAASFQRLSPNGRIPAIVDHAPVDGGDPVSVFESGAILLYLADKAGRFIPAGGRARIEVLEWLCWQVGGLGPIGGQAGHFRVFAPQPVPYAIERYTRELARLYGVLDRRLAGRDYLAGDYSIADMACFPWIVPHAAHGQRLAEFPDLARWYERVSARPRVAEAYAGVEDPYLERLAARERTGSSARSAGT